MLMEFNYRVLFNSLRRALSPQLHSTSMFFFASLIVSAREFFASLIVSAGILELS